MDSNEQPTNPKRIMRKTRTSSRKSKRKTLQKLKQCLSDTSNNVSLKTSLLVQSSDLTGSCFEILNNMCLHACQYQRHGHRLKLSEADLYKASSFYLSSDKLNKSDQTKNNIDLESYVKNDVTFTENAKLFYYGKCLNCCNTKNLEDLSIDSSLKDYFMLTMKAAFGSNVELFTFSLSDLKRNPCILPLLPVFIQNICNDIVLLNYQPNQVKKFLQVIRSLYLNRNLYFRNEYVVHTLNFVISCATSNVSSPICLQEDMSLQDSAAEFIGEIFSKNNTDLAALYNYAVTKLKLPLNALKLRLLPCYGALSAIIEMGLPAIAQVIPSLLLTFLEKLQESLTLQAKEYQIYFIQRYSVIVRKKLLDACEQLLRYYLQEAIDISEISFGCKFKISQNAQDVLMYKNKSCIPLDLELCAIILKHFGEELISQLPSVSNASDENISIDKFFNMLIENSN